MIRDFLGKLDKVDRRIIYILMALSVLIPLVLKLDFPIPVGNGPSTALYDFIDSLPEGSTVLLSFDYDPSTKAELQPMAVALSRHLFNNHIRVIGMALWPQGASLGQQAMSQVGDSIGVRQYYDWVNMGYTVAGSVSILRMGSSIRAVYPQDRDGVPYDSIPLLSGIRRLNDVAMAISLSAGDPGIHAWVMMAGDTYGVPIGGGCTAVSAPEFYTYLGTGQLIGLLGGLRGAADYETLLRQRIPGAPGGLATPGMAAQSVAHLVIMGFIVIGNIAFFAGRKAKKGGVK
jgi:hypothetical protein